MPTKQPALPSKANTQTPAQGGGSNTPMDNLLCVLYTLCNCINNAISEYYSCFCLAVILNLWSAAPLRLSDPFTGVS